MPNLSDLYDVTRKRDIESKAKGGYIRPTVGEHFMSHRDFKEIESFIPATWNYSKKIGNLILSNENKTASLVGEGPPQIFAKAYAEPMLSGKWYWEYALSGPHVTLAAIGIHGFTTSDYPYFREENACYYQEDKFVGTVRHRNVGYSIEHNKRLGLLFNADTKKLDIYADGVFKYSLDISSATIVDPVPWIGSGSTTGTIVATLYTDPDEMYSGLPAGCQAVSMKK